MISLYYALCVYMLRLGRDLECMCLCENGFKVRMAQLGKDVKVKVCLDVNDVEHEA